MEVAGINLLTFVGFVLSIVAAVFDLIGFATPYWSSTSTSLVKVYSGLWRYCVTALGSTACASVGDLDLECKLC